MSFHYRYRKQIIIGLIIGILLISGIAYSIYSIYKNKDKEEKNELLIKKKDNIKEETKNESKDLYQVDIKGEVQNPGIYSLEASSRIIDVINKAGGLKENANTSVINLSKKIIDEMEFSNELKPIFAHILMFEDNNEWYKILDKRMRTFVDGVIVWWNCIIDVIYDV